MKAIVKAIVRATISECLNFRASRGGSGALYSQPAIVRVMSALDVVFNSLPLERGVDVRDLCNRSL